MRVPCPRRKYRQTVNLELHFTRNLTLGQSYKYQIDLSQLRVLTQFDPS